MAPRQHVAERPAARRRRALLPEALEHQLHRRQPFMVERSVHSRSTVDQRSSGHKVAAEEGPVQRRVARLLVLEV
eukprot:scaffold76561_cov62-Phaeocystis_antarctica.AAC.4